MNTRFTLKIAILSEVVVTPANDLAVFGGVSLHAFKAGLGILQDTGAFSHDDVGVGGQAALVPLAVLEVGHIAVISLDVTKAQITPVNVLFLHSVNTSALDWIALF